MNFVDYTCSFMKVFFTNFWGRGTNRRGVACNTEFHNMQHVFLVHAYSRRHLSFNDHFQTNSSLPKPDGPLLTVVPSSSIIAEVKQVAWEKDTRTLTSKHGTYESFTPEKAQQHLSNCSSPNDLVDVVATQDRLDHVGTHLQPFRSLDQL